MPCARTTARRRGLLITLLLLGALLVPRSGLAVAIGASWLAASSGDWDAGANWSTNFPNNGSPIGTDTYDVTIDATGSPYTVTLDTAITVDSLILDSADATVAHSAGTFAVTGTADLQAGVFRVTGGTLQGGTWSQTGGSLQFGNSSSNLLDGVSVIGDLDLTTIANADLQLVNGSTFTGTANLGDAARLGFTDTLTLGAVTINVDSVGGGNHDYFGVGGTNTLTLGASTQVNLLGWNSKLTSDVFASGTGTIVNQGTVTADAGGVSRNMSITPDIFSNQATVEARGGSTLTVGCSSCTLSEVSGGTLTGGTWRVFDGSQLTLYSSPVLTTNQADITLSGATSVFSSADSILLNDTGAALRVLDGRSFTAATPFTNRGTLELGGGTFTAGGTLANQSTAEILGVGTIVGDLDNDGLLAPGFSAGEITVNGTLTLTGSATLDIELGGATQGSGYDFVNVVGDAVLGGALSLSFLDGFENSVSLGDTFTILTASTPLTGAFTNVASGGLLGTTGQPGLLRGVLRGRQPLRREPAGARVRPGALQRRARAHRTAALAGDPAPGQLAALPPRLVAQVRRQPALHLG